MKQFLYALAILGSLFLGVETYADDSSTRTRISVLSLTQRDDFLVVSLKVRGEGILPLKLREVTREVVSGKEVIHLRGATEYLSRLIKRGVKDLSGTSYLTPTGREIVIRFSTRRGGHPRYYSVTLKGGGVRTAFAPHSLLEGERCGVHSDSVEVSSQEEKNRALSLTSLRELELTFGADTQLTKSSLYFASLVNAANVSYERDLGIRIKAKQVHKDQNNRLYPLGSDYDSVEDLLMAFASNVSRGSSPYQSADAYMLVTGRIGNTNDPTLGLTFLGSACNALGIVPGAGAMRTINDAIDHIILAHELAHALGADHTDSGIMTTSVQVNNPRSYPSEFNLASQRQVSSFVGSKGSCLTLSGESSSPTPTPTVTPTRTSRPTATVRPTRTPRPTVTPRPTRTPRPTATPRPTRTPRPTSTPRPTATPRKTPTPRPTFTPRNTPTPRPTATPRITPTKRPTATPRPTRTPVRTPIRTVVS